MTLKEAINYANGMLKDGGNKQKQDFVKVVTEALEKQILKKPLHSGLNYDCPTCLDNVGMLTIRGRVIKHHHCRCGQSIDWSEEC